MSFPSLSIDLYEIWMALTYLETEMEEKAAFEFFVRGPPKARNFILAAGLETLLEFLVEFEVTPEDIETLVRLGLPRERLNSLLGLRFMGDVDAVPEGSVVFADEPIVRIEAPIAQAQLIETALINILHFQTLIASKAARCVIAAQDRELIEFGLRRAHGSEAGLFAARACYLAGFHGTSNVWAGARFGIPVSGTMAHSFIQSHDSEEEAFFSFASHNPEATTLLIDTYDTLEGARKARKTIPRLNELGIRLKAVRLDSGDLLHLSKEVRRLLDEVPGPGRGVKIVASGNLDEWEIRRLIDGGAPIDSFGVGTRIDVSSDRPYLDCAYKLVDYGGRPRLKLSTGKHLLPGKKQIFRRRGPDGRIDHDVLAREGEVLDGEPLLKPVMRHGHRLHLPTDLQTLRQSALQQIHELPDRLKNIDGLEAEPLRISKALTDLADQKSSSWQNSPSSTLPLTPSSTTTRSPSL